jgi:hypothetical protein
MKKHYWIVVTITTALILSIGVAGFVIEANPLERAPAQVTLDVTYVNVLTTAFVAQELGLPQDRVASVTVTPSSGCSVVFNLPLRTDQDEHNGQVIRVRPIIALDTQQQELLDQLMRTQGCFRTQR